MILFVSIPLTSCNSNNNANKTKEHNLSFQDKQRLKIKNDKIKSISITEYGYTFGELNKEGELFSVSYYDTNGCEIKEEKFFRNGTPAVIYSHTYDSTGRRISTIDKKDIDDESYTKTIYRYDSYGNISESVGYYVATGEVGSALNGEVTWKTLYKYNEKGLLERIIVEDETWYEYFYDSSNQLSIFIDYFTGTWRYTYKGGKISSALQYDKNSEPYILRIYTYTYY